jgi:hypothetical protein
MSDEDRLRARMQDRAARVPDLADLDDVAARLGRRRPVRERRLLALVAVALVAGVGIGVAIGYHGDGGGPAVAVAGDGAPDTTLAPTTAAPTAPATLGTKTILCIKPNGQVTTTLPNCFSDNVPPQTLPAPGAEQPADADVARTHVADAYAAAMDGDTGDAQRAAAIERGASLVTVFEQLHSGPYGEQVRSARTVIEGIVFVSPTKAAVKYHAVLGDGSISGPYFGDAVLNDGTWQVSHDSYCQVASLAGVHCPE